jgi:hypothetical protein
LYELLKAEEFKNKGGKFNRELSILDYKSYLGLAIDEYVDFDNFRRRVIEPSVKEVSKSSDLIVNFTFQRSGRKISHIIFHVEQNKQTRLDLETGSPTINEKPSMDSAIELTELGVSEITALELLKKYGEGQVQRNIEYFKSFRKTGAQIKNPTGYLVTAIEKDYAAAQMTMEDSKRAKRDTVAKTKAQLEEKKKQEEQKALEEVLKALDTFDTRPEMERKDIIEEYRQTMNAIVLRGFDKWGYRHASQRAAFVKFLDKYNKT